MRRKVTIAIFTVALGMIWANFAGAQGGPSLPPAQFDITGFIQKATLADVGVTPAASLRLRGGTITVNGIEMIVPNNTIVQMPASSFTWAELFDPANSASIPAGRPNHPPRQTGLALADNRLGTSLSGPFPSMEVRVVGNIIPDPVTGAPSYIVGLVVPITQQGLNVGSGIINYINYGNGMIRVGGLVGDPRSGALVQINDPVGRFGRRHSPDPRFTADTNNPTITAVTGYPVCIPRVAPPDIDPRCPISNRPLNGNPNFPADPFLALNEPLRNFDMPAPGTPGALTDPTKQVPLMVGDWVDYSGTVFKRDPAGPSTPTNMFVSVHTLTANLGIYTAPGTQPAYINSSVLIGTNGGTVVVGYGNPPTGIPQEASTRITVEGFCTDPSRLVDFYAIDVDPVTGAETERLLGTVLPEDGVTKLRPRGRYRFIIGKGAFTPVTREYIAKTRTGQTPNVANGLTAGQYRLPCFDYIVPEGTIMGQPIPPANFLEFPFLAQGSGPLFPGGPIVGRLDPWPGDILPGPGVAAAAPASAPAVAAGVTSEESDALTVMPRGRRLR